MQHAANRQTAQGVAVRCVVLVGCARHTPRQICKRCEIEEAGPTMSLPRGDWHFGGGANGCRWTHDPCLKVKCQTDNGRAKRRTDGHQSTFFCVTRAKERDLSSTMKAELGVYVIVLFSTAAHMRCLANHHQEKQGETNANPGTTEKASSLRNAVALRARRVQEPCVC